MAKKKIGEKKGEKKAATKKVAKKPKKVPSKRKKAEKGRAKIAREKTAKKPVKKRAKKVKAKTTKKTPKKAKAKAEVKKKKVAKKVKVKAKVKAKVKEKRPSLKGGKKVKAITKKPKEKVKVRKVVPAAPPLPIEVLPEEYGENSIALMTVDPRKLFIYWEVKGDTLARYEGTINVRIYDVTNVDFDGTNANSYLDIPVSQRIGNWYIDVVPEREYIVDIGIKDPSGVFISVARSNKVSTPRAGSTEEGGLPQRLYEIDIPVGY